MKPYKVPRNSRIRILEKEDAIGPPGSIALNLQDTYYFGHIDGMYSYCKTCLVLYVGIIFKVKDN